MFGRNYRLSIQVTPSKFRFVQLLVSSKSCSLVKAFEIDRKSAGNNGTNPAGEAEELRNILQSAKIKASDVRVVFDDLPVSVTTLSLSRNMLDNFQENTNWYAEQYSPVQVENAAVSCRLCGTETSDPATVVLVATEKRKVMNVASLLSNAGIKVKKMDIVPFAIEKLFYSNINDRGVSASLVGLDDSNATVLVLKKGNLDFVRYFKIFPDMTAEYFADRVKLTLQSYSDREPLADVMTLFFCRMTKNFPEAEQIIGEKTGLSVEVLDPMKNVSWDDDELIPAVDGLRVNSFAPLIGAAL